MGEGVRDEEAFCFEVVRRVTGHTVEPYDIGGRQGAVDGLLIYPDGTRAAIEVTSKAGDGQRQLESELAADGFTWHLPEECEWKWTVSIGNVADVPLARRVFARVVVLCERHGASRPTYLPHYLIEDDAELTLLDSSSVIFHGSPTLTPEQSGSRRVAHVLPAGVGGFAQPGLDGLNNELVELLKVPSVARRLTKVCAFDADECHLMIVLHVTALSFPLICGLIEGTDLPPRPLTGMLPPRLSHLWLLPNFAARVLLWSPDGWSQHYPYDS